MRLSAEEREDMPRQQSEFILRSLFDLRPTQEMLLSVATANVLVMAFARLSAVRAKLPRFLQRIRRRS